MLTTHHLRLAKLALDSRNYADATQVLEKFILYVPGASTVTKPKHPCEMTLSPVSYITHAAKLTGKIKYIEILEYFLYSGMVFIGLRNWETALQCLESAVTYPAKEGSVSKVMLDAYKKWILVGLLLEGKLLPLPKTTSNSAARCYHVMAKPYETFAQIFENGSASRLKAEAEAASAIWRDDHNEGLVVHVLAAYQKFQIRALANVYSKISIPEIVSQTTSAETGIKLPSAQAGEALIRSMIQLGELHARLSPPTTSGPSILTFSPTGQVLTEHEMQRELTTSAERIKSLTKEVKQTDRMLTHDKEYIKHVQKQKKNTKGGAQSSSHEYADTGMEWDDGADALEDEDIMGPMY
jgi:COP9 signalosome complex subunit 3